MTLTKVILVMLAGGHRGSVVLPALASVAGIVDEVLLVDSGTADDVIDVAREFFAGKPVHVAVLPGGNDHYDCATARNFGLDSATARNFGLDSAAKIEGATHAVMLDTDERLHWGGVDIRTELERMTADIALTHDDGREYPKARFFRLPKVGGYVDRCHEIYSGANSISLMQGVTFSELPRSDEEQVERMAGIRRICEQWIIDEPGYARAWLHLANTEVFFKEWHLALQHFLKAAELTHFDEERAWCLYRAAGCHEDLEEYKPAIELCALAMAACPYFAEPPFLSAWCSVKLNRHFDALAWSRTAVAHGKMSPIPVVTPIRAGFTVPLANFEGPFDILEATYRAMGPAYDGLAEQANVLYTRAALRGQKP